MMASGFDAFTHCNIQTLRLSQLHVSIFKLRGGWIKVNALPIFLAKCGHGIALFIDAGDDKALGLLVIPLGEYHAWLVMLNEWLLRFREKVRNLSEEGGLDARKGVGVF